MLQKNYSTFNAKIHVPNLLCELPIAHIPLPIRNNTAAGKLCYYRDCFYVTILLRPVASFTKEVNPRLAKRTLIFNGHLANRGLTSVAKVDTGIPFTNVNVLASQHEKVLIYIIKCGMKLHTYSFPNFNGTTDDILEMNK